MTHICGERRKHRKCKCTIMQSCDPLSSAFVCAVCLNEGRSGGGGGREGEGGVCVGGEEGSGGSSVASTEPSPAGTTNNASVPSTHSNACLRCAPMVIASPLPLPLSLVPAGSFA